MIKIPSNINILFIILFSVIIIIRLVKLDTTPIFGDEALYLDLSNRVIQNPSTWLDSLKYDVLPVSIWALALFGVIGDQFLNPLIVGRLAQIFFDIVSAFIIYLIGIRLFGKRVGIIASIIYLSNPLVFFHGRLVLLEPLTNLLTLSLVYLALKFYFEESFSSEKKLKKIKIFLIVIFSLTLLAAFFTKPLMAVSLPAILLIPLLFKKNKYPSLNLLIGFILGVGLISLFYLPLSKSFASHYLSKSNQSFDQSLLHLKLNLWRVFWWLKAYLTFPILFTTLLGFLLALFKKDRRLIWVIVWIVTIIFIESFFSANFYPRHLYLIAGPVALLISNILLKISKDRIILVSLLTLFLLVESWILNFNIIFKPQTAKIALEDRQQFFEDWTSGVGNKQITLKLKELSKKEQIFVFVEDTPSQTYPFSNLYDIGNTEVIPSTELFQGQFVNSPAFTQDKQKFLILNRNPSAPSSWPVKLIYSYPKGPVRTINLYQILD